MKKNPQYNQQAEPKQCKSEVEEICTPEPGNWHHRSILSENCGFRGRENPL